MDGYEAKVRNARIVALIAVILVLALCLAAVVMFSSTDKSEPSVQFVKTDDHDYELVLTYDREMVGGTVKVRVADAENDLKFDVSMTPDDDSHVVRGKFHVDQDLTDPRLATYGETTNMYSMEQMLDFMLALFVIAPLMVICAMTAVRGLTVSVRKYSVDGSDVTFYCGLMRHELTVNGVLAGKMNTPIPFMSAWVETVLATGNLRAEASIMNVPTVIFNGNAVKESGS